MNFKNTLSLGAAVLLFTAGGAFAQVKKKPTPSPKSKPIAAAQLIKPQLLPTDPNVLTGKLPNGLTYYIRSNAAAAKRAELYLVNKAGSVLETDAQRGFAHFITHLAVAGTRDFSKTDIADFLQKAGIKFSADSNAYATYDQTTYQLSLPTDTAQLFEKGFSLLANWAGYIKFDPADINSSRDAVLNEISQGGTNVKDHLDKLTLPILLNNSRYAQRLPLGTEAAIKTADATAIKAFYKDWYRPDLQAIIVVGDFDPQRAEKLIKDNFSDLPNPAVKKPLPLYPAPPAPGTVVKVITAKDLPYAITQIVVKHPQVRVKTSADLLQNMRINFFNQMLAARMEEVKQQSNSPFLFAQAGYNGFIGKQDAFTATAISMTPGLEASVKAIAAETERIRRFGFVSSELERVKQNSLMQLSVQDQQKDNMPSGAAAVDYERNFLTGDAITGITYEYNYYIDNIGKVSLADMNALAAKLITDQNRTILVEGPESDKVKLPAEATVLKWFVEAGKGLTPYVDNASIPLMTQLPVAGKVVSSKMDSTILVTYLTLSNGVKVILKPTQFQEGQILISGYAFGGTSLVSDQDYTSASLSSRVISNSGVAGFDQTQMERMLRNKGLNVSPYIGDISQGVSGYSSAADFETALQLLYLYFTQPRKDVAVWNATIAQSKGQLVTRAVDARNIFQDTATAVLSNYNPRVMPTTAAQLNAASFDKAFDFYKDRFADASNFTFTFTGSFTVEGITPYLEAYLGALPATNKKETYKNLGIHPASGQVTKTVYKGTADKSTVELIFSGSYEYNEANNIQLDALESVLNLRLAQRFDEKSGVISPGAGISYVKIPENRYRVTVEFDCAPADVDKLVALVLEEINKLKQDGADAKEVRTFVLQDARSTQTQLRQNAFWGGSLSAAAQNQEDPDRILNHVQSLDQVTIATTKDAVNKYLNSNNLIKLILMPEKK